MIYSTRRNWICLPLHWLWLCSTLLTLEAAHSEEKASAGPINLRCDGQVGLAKVSSSLPKFGWQLQSENKGMMQAAYHILAGSSPNLLELEKADLWDSGEIQGGKSDFVEYQGRMLQEDQNFFWKVRIKDRSGNWTNWSAPAEAMIDWPLVTFPSKVRWFKKESGPSTFSTSQSVLTEQFLKSQSLLAEPSSFLDLSHALRVANHHYELGPSVKPLLRQYCVKIDDSGLYVDSTGISGKPTPDLSGGLVLALFSYWWSTGDLEFVKRHWNALFSNVVKTHEIMSHKSRIDWENLAAGFMPEGDATPAREACKLRHAISIRLMIEMARFCSQNPHETKILLTHQDELLNQLADILLDESGAFKHPSAFGLVMAFRSGLFRDQSKQDLNKRMLMGLLRVEKAPALGTNEYFTMNLLPLLAALGEADVAIELAIKASEEDPARTTVLGVNEWLMASVAGIEALEPGFASFRVTPGIAYREHLKFAKAEFPGARGLIKTHWYVSGEGYGFEISVPPNSIAVVTLPKREGAQLLESGMPLADQKFVFGIKDHGNTIEFRVAPGSYHFKSE